MQQVTVIRKLQETSGRILSNNDKLTRGTGRGYLPSSTHTWGSFLSVAPELLSALILIFRSFFNNV